MLIMKRNVEMLKVIELQTGRRCQNSHLSIIANIKVIQKFKFKPLKFPFANLIANIKVLAPIRSAFSKRSKLQTHYSKDGEAKGSVSAQFDCS